MAARLRWAAEWLAQNCGVTLLRGSRLDLALRNLDWMADANASGDPLTSVLLEQLIANNQAAWELYLAVVCASHVTYSGHPFTAERFRTILRGAEIEEGRDRGARNIEFELTVASRLYLGGISVFGGEPDLRIDYGGELAGFAVKRITSPKMAQVKASIKKAVQQIERSRMRGFIALKLERRLENVTASPDEFEFLHQVDKCLQEVLDLSRYYSDNPHVVGLFATSSISIPRTTLAPNGLPELDTNMPWRYIKFQNAIDVVTKGDFWGSWEATLDRNLRILARAVPTSSS